MFFSFAFTASSHTCASHKSSATDMDWPPASTIVRAVSRAPSWANSRATALSIDPAPPASSATLSPSLASSTPPCWIYSTLRDENNTNICVLQKGQIKDPCRFDDTSAARYPMKNDDSPITTRRYKESTSCLVRTIFPPRPSPGKILH